MAAVDNGHRKNAGQTDPKLAEEIDNLRRLMQERFEQEHSFTAECVMELSRQLDLKINEYMRMSQNNKR